MKRWAILTTLFTTIGCGGGTAGTEAGSIDDSGPGSGPTASTPQLPAVTGEVIGRPGAPVPGLNASYVTTEMGWLGPDDDVIFEAVIQWRDTLELGCGIFRRGPDGNVNEVLLQGQLLPGTGGVVKHPRLPLEARGDTLVIPALVDGGSVVRGLFLVPKTGGSPTLIAIEEEREFVGAVLNDDGTVLTEARGKTGSDILRIVPGGATTKLCADCAPGFQANDTSVIVVKDGDAFMIGFDGVATRLIGRGDPLPGLAIDIRRVLRAGVTDAGEFVVHVDTGNPTVPDALVRVGGKTETLAACGQPAPGTQGTFKTLTLAAGQGPDVVFGATIDGDAANQNVIYCARPGDAPELLAADGAEAAGALLSISTKNVVAGENGNTAVGAHLFEEGALAPHAEGVFVHDGTELRCILTTNAEVASLPNTTVVSFPIPIRNAVHVRADGRTLVHTGLREDRRPNATLGALILVR